MNCEKIGHIAILILMATLLWGCTEAESDPRLAGGRQAIDVRLTAPYHRVTRASGDWLDPDHPEELIHQYWVCFVAKADNTVSYIAQGDAEGAEQHAFRFYVVPGQYTVYAFANLDFAALGITEGSAVPDLSDVKTQTPNGFTGQIPMTSHTGGQDVTVAEAENQSFEVELVRTMAKLEMNFTNVSTQQMDLLGYEIYPLANAGSVSLQEPADETDITNAATVAYRADLTASPVVLAAGGGEGKVTVYINETNATATAIENQWSIRLKMQRHKSTTTEVEEYRYGFTVPKTTVGETTEGFTYIHRNDWIKIPLQFTPWQFRIETLPFPPIAGFQSRVVSADALSITFNTGGYIFLRPMFRNEADEDGAWRTFQDADAQFVFSGDYTVVSDTRIECIDPATGTGIAIDGALGIFDKRSDGSIAYFKQQTSGDIVGYLTNDSRYGSITVTVYVRLEGFLYQFYYTITKENS